MKSKQIGRFTSLESSSILLNPKALRKAKIVYNFGLSECHRVKLFTFLTLFIFFQLNLLHRQLFQVVIVKMFLGNSLKTHATILIQG